MGDHARVPPWKVFTTPDGLRLVGIGAEDGGGILDCGYGVWAGNDAEGIANAEMVVKAVNNHEALVKALEQCGADFATRPGSVMECAAQINNEFQRRMEIASEALQVLVEGK